MEISSILIHILIHIDLNAEALRRSVYSYGLVDRFTDHFNCVSKFKTALTCGCTIKISQHKDTIIIVD